MTASSEPLRGQPVVRKASGEMLRPGSFTLNDRAVEMVGLVPGWKAPRCEEWFRRGAYDISIVEEHTALLKALAVRLIFARGGRAREGCSVRQGVGYYLMIAEKDERQWMIRD